MRIHLVNPSDLSFGTAVITPRWLYVLAAATPTRIRRAGDRRRDTRAVRRRSGRDWRCGGDRHPHRQRACAATRSASSRAREARLSSSAAFTRRCFRTKPASAAPRTPWSQAMAIMSGATVLADCRTGSAAGTVYNGGRIEGDAFFPARWDLLPADRYMWGSVQTVRGCPKHCSFCSVWRTDGQKPRQRRRRGRRRARSSQLRRRGIPLHRCWPTTTSIRSRWRISRWPPSASDKRQLRGARGDPRRSDSS